MSVRLSRAPRFGLDTYSVLGTPVAVVQIPQLIAAVEGWIGERAATRCLTFSNVHVVMEGLHQPAFHELLTDKDVLNMPDGAPLAWLGKHAGLPVEKRVNGPGFMLEFFRATAGKGYRHYFYGGAPGVAEELARKLKEQFLGTEVVGLDSPPFRPLTPEEDEEAMERIRQAKPDIVWVGLGCPKQEFWAFGHRERLGVPILAAVGQAFDLHAGRMNAAPEWMSSHGLEWLYRLCREPRRLWRRYLVYNSQFLYSLFLQKIGLRRFD